MTMADSCQPKTSAENAMRFLTYYSNYMPTEDLRNTMTLSNEALVELSLTECPLLMQGVHIVQGAIVPSACSIFEIELLQNFHSSERKL